MRTRLLFMALLASNVLMAQVPLKVKTTEKEYRVEDATHITFSEDLAVQAIHTKADDEILLPMRDVREVILRDTLQNVTNYILADSDCKIYNWAVFSDLEQVYMGTHFYSNFADPAQRGNATAFTPELRSRFALFVPTDSAFADTVPYGISFVSLRTAAISLLYNKRNSGIPVTVRLCYYDPETGVVKQRIPSVALSNACIARLLNEMLLQHTIFFDRPEDRELGIRSGNEYFKTMDGNVIRVAADGKSVQGVLQMDNEAKGLEVFTTSNIIDSHQKDNGTVYKIDSPILPPAIQKSAYSVLSGEGYEEFFKLCRVDYDVLEALSLVDPDYPASTCEKLRAFFSTFVKKNGADYNLSFFPNHPFTLYAPTNEAVRRAIADGLPTWESLAGAYGGGVGSDVEREEGRRKVYELINFVRYHFHFGTEIADKLPFAAREHATPVILPDSHTTPQLRVSSAGNGTLSVTDATGQTLQVMDEGKNVFVRDVECSENPTGTSISNLYMEHSSPGVIHRINGVLRYK
ncbi:MAG: fasciclin domain-containing protein [Bacteroidaceae bacterium]|nr:fasciclin domain-containing protein [Bacteroidaceae bacterium]